MRMLLLWDRVVGGMDFGKDRVEAVAVKAADRQKDSHKEKCSVNRNGFDESWPYVLVALIGQRALLLPLVDKISNIS